jgi:ankyrin repeat protein
MEQLRWLMREKKFNPYRPIENESRLPFLMVAMNLGNNEAVRIILEEVPPSSTDYRVYDGGNTVMHVAASNFDVDLFRDLAEAYRAPHEVSIVDMLTLPDSDGETPLMVAAFYGNFNVFKHMVQLGADPTQINIHGMHCGFYVCRTVSEAAFKQNLQGGDIRNVIDGKNELLQHLIKTYDSSYWRQVELETGNTPLLHALVSADVQFHQLQTLLSVSDPFYENKRGRNFFSQAVFSNHLGLCKQIEALTLEYDGKRIFAPNHPDRAGFTPLSNAIRHGQKPGAVFLLQSGADPNIPDHNGGTPIIYAASIGEVDLLRALMKAKANVNQVSTEGSHVTALQKAVEEGHNECATTLLLAGATVPGGINKLFRFLTTFVDPTRSHRIQTSEVRKSIAFDLGALACLCLNCDDDKEEPGIAIGAIKKHAQLVSAALEEERNVLLSGLAPAMNDVKGVMKIVFEYARTSLVDAIKRIPR